MVKQEKKTFRKYIQHFINLTPLRVLFTFFKVMSFLNTAGENKDVSSIICFMKQEEQMRGKFQRINW